MQFRFSQTPVKQLVLAKLLMNKEREREREREADGRTDGRTDGQLNRETVPTETGTTTEEKLDTCAKVASAIKANVAYVTSDPLLCQHTPGLAFSALNFTIRKHRAGGWISNRKPEKVKAP